MFCPVYRDSISKTKTVFNQDRTQFLRIVRIARAIQYCFGSQCNVNDILYTPGVVGIV